MEINDQDFKEFVYQLKHSLGPALDKLSKSGTTGTIGDSGINKLINAIGLLSVTMTQATGKKRSESKALDEFTTTVEKSTKRQEEAAKAQNAATDSTDELAKAQTEAVEATEELSRTQRLTAKIAEEFNSILGLTTRESVYARRKNQEEQNQTANYFREQISQYSTTNGLMGLAGDGFKYLAGNSVSATIAFEGLQAVVSGVTAGLTSMTKAIYSGERGAKVSAKAFSALVDPIASFAQGLGGALIALGTVAAFTGVGTAAGIAAIAAGTALVGLGLSAKVVTATLELAAEQSDKLFKSYNDLSASGINASRGMTGVIDMAHELRYSVSQLDEFNKFLGDNAKTMKFFGGTTVEGVHAYSKATNILLNKFGPELEQLGITAQEQREAALSYMSIQARTGGLQLKNANELAKGTAGYLYELDAISRLTGETRKEQEAAREAAMSDERFRSALVDAKNRGDKTEIARLEKAQAMASALTAAGDKKGATGVLQIAASRGALTTPEAIAAEMTYGVTKALNNPNLTSTQALIDMSKNAEAQQRQLSGINSFIGGIGPLQTDVVAIANVIDKLRPAIEAAQKAGYGKDVEGYLKSEQGRAKFGDKDLQAMINAGRKQQAAAITMDQVLLTYNGAAKLNDSASKLFNDAVNTFAKAVGARKGPNPYTGSTGTTGTGALPRGQAAAQKQMSGISSFFGNSNTGSQRNKNYQSEVSGTPGSLDRIQNLIGSVESRGNYNALVGGSTANLTDMTISEVFQQQAQMQGNYQSTAVGKYQIIKGTLEGLVNKLGLDPNTTKFNPATQDMLAAELIKEKGYDKYQGGTLSKEQFLASLAKTWAGLPASPQGGYYDGQNGNKAGIGWDAALQSFGNGGVVTAKSGGQVILTAEAGLNEAVVPLPDGKAIPVNLGSGFDKMVAIMEQTNAILQNLHSTSKDTYSVNSKILQATRA